MHEGRRVFFRREGRGPTLVAARFREVAPRAGVVPLPGVGHDPQSEAPGRTPAAFYAFHDSIGTPRAGADVAR